MADGRRGPRPARTGAPGGGADDTSLVAKAYESIKEKIITLYFLPGQYLNEAAVSALLGLGRTPVHQALQRLHLEGLVEVMPRKGVIVLPDSIAELVKILDSRLAVEPELARKAAEGEPDPETCAELRRLAIAPTATEGLPDIDAFTVCDRAFHRRIGDLSGNKVMAEFAGRLHERSTRYWYLHMWQTLDVGRSNRQHGAVAEAVCRGDTDGAAGAMREHIEVMKDILERLPAAAPRSGGRYAGRTRP